MIKRLRKYKFEADTLIPIFGGQVSAGVAITCGQTLWSKVCIVAFLVILFAAVFCAVWESRQKREEGSL